MSHYFEEDPEMQHEFRDYSFGMFGRQYTFQSDAGVFSKDGLDDGSKLLLDTIAKMDLGCNILDLGCGIGPIGLVLASLDPHRFITLSDVNTRALACCETNAARLGLEKQVRIIVSNVYESISDKFSSIVTNPPIRAGKEVTYAMYKGALSHLDEGGSLFLVIRKQQGADSAMRYLQTLFAHVEVLASKKGYKILQAYKGVHYAD